jgi:tRNA A37 methylthiotransferase MiaB
MQHILTKLIKLVDGSTYINIDMIYHNTMKATKKILSIFWYYVLPDDSPFRPKHTVSEFLIYIIIILSCERQCFFCIIVYYRNCMNKVRIPIL